MDLAQEKRRLRELDAYGVKTARQWNVWQAEWERQHPKLAVARRVGGGVLLTLITIAVWLPVVLSACKIIQGD